MVCSWQTIFFFFLKNITLFVIALVNDSNSTFFFKIKNKIIKLDIKKYFNVKLYKCFISKSKTIVWYHLRFKY